MGMKIWRRGTRRMWSTSLLILSMTFSSSRSPAMVDALMLVSWEMTAKLTMSLPTRSMSLSSLSVSTRMEEMDSLLRLAGACLAASAFFFFWGAGRSAGALAGSAHSWTAGSLSLFGSRASTASSTSTFLGLDLTAPASSRPAREKRNRFWESATLKSAVTMSGVTGVMPSESMSSRAMTEAEESLTWERPSLRRTPWSISTSPPFASRLRMDSSMFSMHFEMSSLMATLRPFGRGWRKRCPRRDRRPAHRRIPRHRRFP